APPYAGGDLASAQGCRAARGGTMRLAHRRLRRRVVARLRDLSGRHQAALRGHGAARDLEGATALGAPRPAGCEHRRGDDRPPPCRQAEGRMSFFVRPRPLANPSLRVVAFHHAGGSAAMYHPMSAEMPADWELFILDLPGRGKRYGEEPICTPPALIAHVVE